MALFNKWSGASESALVSIFGKHPAHADHFEIFPSGTKAAAVLWTEFYREGIGNSISIWRETPSGELVAGFDHIVAGRLEGRWIIARLWNSQDGATSPRREFPLVCCVETAVAPTPKAIMDVVGALDALGNACRAATDADGLRSAAAAAQERFAALLTRDADSPATTADDLVRSLAASLLPQFDDESLIRALHAIGASGLDISSEKPAAVTSTSRHYRLPGNAAGPLLSLAAWSILIRRLANPHTPYLLATPKGSHWIDCVIGPASGAQWVCLKYADSKVPLVSSVPYTVTPGLRNALDRIMGRTPSNAAASISAPAALPAAPIRRDPPKPTPTSAKPATHTPDTKAARPMPQRAVKPQTQHSAAAPSKSRLPLIIAAAAVPVVGLVLFMAYPGSGKSNSPALASGANVATATPAAQPKLPQGAPVTPPAVAVQPAAPKISPTVPNTVSDPKPPAPPPPVVVAAVSTANPATATPTVKTLPTAPLAAPVQQVAIAQPATQRPLAPVQLPTPESKPVVPTAVVAVAAAPTPPVSLPAVPKEPPAPSATVAAKPDVDKPVVETNPPTIAATSAPSQQVQKQPDEQAIELATITSELEKAAQVPADWLDAAKRQSLLDRAHTIVAKVPASASQNTQTRFDKAVHGFETVHRVFSASSYEQLSAALPADPSPALLKALDPALQADIAIARAQAELKTDPPKAKSIRAALLAQLRSLPAKDGEAISKVCLGLAPPVVTPISKYQPTNGWSFAIDPTDDRVAALSSGDVRVRLRRVDMPAYSVFLSSSEMPITVLQKLLLQRSVQLDDVRRPKLMPWLTAGSGFQYAVTTIPCFQATIDAARKAPGLMPLQGLTPNEICRIAMALGCRLPAVDEWKAALRASASASQPNLRDAAWAEHRSREGAASCAAIAAGDSVYGRMPVTAGTVWNTDPTAPAGDQSGFRDGEALLRLSSASDGFTDLVGNLAELVIGAREDWSASGSPASRLCATGGSFMSPPEDPVDKKIPLAAGALKTAYSDLGFRIAIECEVAQTPQDSDAAVIQSLHFLTPGK